MSHVRTWAYTAWQVMSSTIGVLLVLLFVVVQFRSCTGAAWLSGTEPAAYTLIGADGRVLSIYILPANKVALWYADPAKNEREAALALWRGTFGDHYGWGIWHMEEAPVPGPNWRIFPRGFEPVFMEMEWLEKFREGPGNPVLPNQGESTRGFILLSEDRSSLVFSDMTLRKDEPNPILAAHLEELFADEEVREALSQIGSKKIRELGRRLSGES